MNDKQKKTIAAIANGVIFVGIALAIVFAYKGGYQQGQVAFCEENDLTLVNYQGQAQCWDDFRVEAYKKQWEIGGNNGLQYNITG